MAEILDAQVLDDSWATFLKLRVRLDSGAVVSRQAESHADVAAVLPYDPQRRSVLLARQFRPVALYAGGPEALTEAPAGLLDPGEAAETAARREALEEVGVRLGPLDFVARVWTTPGISTERMWLYLAPFSRADRVAKGGGLAGEQEHIEVVERALDDLACACENGDIDDAKTLILVQALRLRRPELFASRPQSGQASAGGDPP